VIKMAPPMAGMLGFWLLIWMTYMTHMNYDPLNLFVSILFKNIPHCILFTLLSRDLKYQIVNQGGTVTCLVIGKQWLIIFLDTFMWFEWSCKANFSS
jgi:hypothetical protein